MKKTTGTFKVAVFALCAVAAYLSAGSASAQSPAQTPSQQALLAVRTAGDNNPISQPAAALYPDIVAEANGTKITRDELIQETLRAHGQEVLQRMLNRALILAECKRRNIVVTRDDVDKEIDRLAKRFNMDRKQFLDIVQKDNSMTPDQYAEEVIWPKLALDALVAGDIQVSDDELQRKFLSKFGPSLQMQLIVCESKAKADEVRAKAAANPESFGDLAMKESKDVVTASNRGRMQPIFHYTLPDAEIEKTIFAMNPGDVSPVIGPYGPEKNFLIFKCENKYDSQVPADKVAQVKERLRSDAASDKLKGAAQRLFEQLGKEAKIENILARPELRAQYPNLAATVNGQPVYLASVVEMSLRLYGRQDLETLISMRLIEQELKKVQVVVSEQEIDTEIWIKAAETTMPLADGSPNIKEYMRSELAKYTVPEETYRKTIVWPTVALKKLSAGLVKITPEDIQRSFDANFGPSVQCLGIVVRDERRAREVWQQARTLPQKEKRPLPEVFGDLAAKYSMEPGSKQMRGRIPPIIKNGGSPEMEKEAFALKPGELSSVIQVERDMFVILYCVEIVPAKDVKLEQVKDTLRADLQRKKEVLAINEYFRSVMDRSTVINHLTNQAVTPKSKTLPQQGDVPGAKPGTKPGAKSDAKPGAEPRSGSIGNTSGGASERR